MKTIVGVAIGLGIIAVGAFVYAVCKRKEPLLEETVEGDLKLEDVVAYFKTLSMVKGKQIPFLALPGEEKLKVINIKSIKSNKSKVLILGVYNNDKDSLNPMKIVYADGFDEELTEVLGNETLVVLS